MKSVVVDLARLGMQHTGIPLYARNLVRALACSPRLKNSRLVVLASADMEDALTLTNTSVVIICKRRAALNLFFYEVGIFMHFLVNKYEDGSLFISPSHRLPFYVSSNFKILSTIHDVVYKLHPNTMRLVSLLLDKIHVRWCVSKSDRLLTFLPKTSRDIIRFFPKAANKIIVSPMGIREIRCDGNISSHIKNVQRSSFFLFVGTLEPRKNIDKIIQGYEYALSMRGGLLPKLVIVGAPGWGGIKSLVDEKVRESREQILYFPETTDADLCYLYKNCEFVVMPTLYEGLGMPIIEAAAFGKTAIVQKGSPLEELFGCSLSYVDENCAISIGGTLIKLAENPNLRRKKEMSLSGKLANFEWQTHVNSILANFNF